MQKLSKTKELHIIELYLTGLSHAEIATRSGVGKGTVANVIAALRAGQFPDARDVTDLVESLRELSLDLRRAGLTSAEAIVGITVL